MNNVSPVPSLRANSLVLFCLFVFIFLIGTETFLISPMLPNIASTLGVSITHAANLIVAYVLMYAVLGPFFGIISDYKGRTYLILSGAVLFIIGNFLAGVTGSLSALLFSRALMGCGAAAAGPSIWAFIADTTHSSIRGRVMSYGMASFSLGQILGVPLGSAISMYFGWHATFLCIGSITFILIPILITSLIQYPSVNKVLNFSIIFSSFKILNNQEVILAFSTTFFWAMANLGSYGYLGALLKDRFMLNVGQVGMVVVFVGVGSFVGSLLAGKLADYFRARGRKEEMLVACWVAILGCSITGFVYSTSLLLDLALLLFWFVSSGAFVTSQQTLLTALAPNMRGAAISINNSLMYAGTATGVSLIGLTIMNNYENIVWVAMLSCLFALTCTILLLQRRKVGLRARMVGG